MMKSFYDLMDLSGRRALVTGGAGHIGLAVVNCLLELGATVGLLDRDPIMCERLARELSTNGRVFAVPCNLSDENEVRKVVRHAIAEMGGLEIVVHSAAYVGTTGIPGWAVPLEEQQVEPFEAAMRVNVSSVLMIVQEAKEALSKSGKGSVVCIASIYGLVGPDMSLYEGTSMGNPAGYGASKGALLSLTKYLATVLAPSIRVNAVSPGGVWRGQPEKFIERYIQKTPMGRMAIEEDLKGAVGFLASDLSRYVTGHNLVVDGGWTVW
jgi:NAD(P)-dependent dehydrogenase (short-subunit alcohol dehydrogenase family)